MQANKRLLLKIINLKAQVADKPILKGLDLKLASGRILALMGPNGSGKSTLAAVLAGHPSYKVTGGGIKFLGQDLLALSPDERAQAGLFLAFQHPVEVPGVKVWQFLRRAHQARFGSEAKRQFKTALSFRQFLENEASKLSIDPQLVRRGLNEGFSGGEKKRLEMLQMLVLKPKLAILDEIDSGLDVDALRIVGQAVGHLAKEGAGVMLITHYPKILKHVQPHQVLIMLNGEIVETGKLDLINKIDQLGYNNFNHEK